MASSPSLGKSNFALILPKPLQSGDEIKIKARVPNDAESFSINLCMEEDDKNEPMFIAYHLGLNYSDKDCQVRQASRNKDWTVEPKTVDSAFNSRIVDLILRVDDENIKVFHEDTQHFPDYEFAPNVPIESIRSVQLRNCDATVEEIQLKFKY